MRIIGGYLTGKKIFEPGDNLTRPLKDIVRESIFNILEHSKNEFVEMKNSKILDLFSGTGSFGIECLSRRASEVIFFENYKKSFEILKKNIEKLELIKKTKLFQENAYNINRINFSNRCFDIIFLDPPFKDDQINKLLSEIKKCKITNDKTILIIHRNSKFKEKTSINLNIIREKKYGLSKIIFGRLL